MIFKDKLNEKGKIIQPEMKKLLNLALKNQFHNGDLLLLYINGFFEESVHIGNQHSEKKYNPHVIGPGSEGHSEITHYQFIDNYRTTHIHPMTHADYIKQFVIEKWDKEISERNNELTETEETTIQIEMLIYLKFWEADLIIKKLFQFVRMLNHESYDWYFKISESSRDKDGLGTRQDIIRNKIRERLKPFSPVIYGIINETYKTQIRNSIAHSNYSFQGRYIHPNNYIKEDPASQLKSLSFDNWIDIFHNTLVLHNELIKMCEDINDYYANIAKQQNNQVEILITEKYGKQYSKIVEYREQYRDWHYKQ